MKKLISVLLVCLLALSCTGTAFADSEIHVATVDEFIAAIAPGAVIVLDEGEYNLTSASTYGGAIPGSYCSWQEQFDGYELLVSDVDSLTLRGAGTGATLISADPRYANVLAFAGCSGIRIEGITLGHTQAPGYCVGGVLNFSTCSNVLISSCGLYGCGVLGISCNGCTGVTAENTEIYSCSYGAVECRSTYDMRLSSCRIYNCGNCADYCGFQLFDVENSTGFALVNCSVENCTVENILYSAYSQSVALLGTEFKGCTVNASVFACYGYSPVADNCSFTDIKTPMWYDYTGTNENLVLLSPDGAELYKADFLSMERKDCEYSGPAGGYNPSAVPAEGEQTEISVSTVDEFLAALGSNRVIRMGGGVYNLSEASNYGSYSCGNYSWTSGYDGPGLMLTGVSNLTILGEGAEIIAEPRYADVISFEYCNGITLEGITAGHNAAGGECSGGVLYFYNCSDFSIGDCRLFGCGILGLRMFNCSGFCVDFCEIFECSQGGVALCACYDTTFSRCCIHNCEGYPLYIDTGSYGTTWDGAVLAQGYYFMNASGDFPVSAGNYDFYGTDGDSGAIKYRFPDYDEEFPVQFGEQAIVWKNVPWALNFEGSSVAAKVRFKPGWLPFAGGSFGNYPDADGYYTYYVSEGVPDSLRPAEYAGMSQAYSIKLYYAPQFTDGGALLMMYSTPGSIVRGEINGCEALETCAYNKNPYTGEVTNGNYLIMYSKDYGYIIVVCGEAPMQDLEHIASTLELDVTRETVFPEDFERRYDFFDIGVG